MKTVAKSTKIFGRVWDAPLSQFASNEKSRKKTRKRKQWAGIERK